MPADAEPSAPVAGAAVSWLCDMGSALKSEQCWITFVVDSLQAKLSVAARSTGCLFLEELLLLEPVLLSSAADLSSMAVRSMADHHRLRARIASNGDRGQPS